MRNLTFKTFTAIAVCCMVMALASPGFAQWRGSSRSYSRVSIDRLIRQAENRSDQFVAIFDRALDRSRLEGSIREDRLNERALQLERELNIVRQQFNRTGNHYSIRAHVSNALNVAQGINTVMRNQRLHPVAERHWMLLRSDLNRLAAVYNLRQLR
ncbi:MAG TPA: hypothetical protein VFO63_04095 [Blastocatellia bacterium]|nr:hypothetical protein [Blastocatellia bacterium]